MLWATARSVREERSKQRSALQDFSRIRVSLIKGKSGWRIGSSEALGNAFLSSDTRNIRALVNFVVQELRRYVHGEVPLPAIYDDAVEILSTPLHFKECSELTQKVFSLRLMSDLGYVASSPIWEKVTRARSVKGALEWYEATMDAPIRKALKEGAHSSHL